MIDVIEFNHVSNTLTSDQIDELKSYYRTYHKKMWTFKKAYKKFKKRKLIGNILTGIFATGGISSSIFTSSISLIATAAVAYIIHTYTSNIKILIEKNINVITPIKDTGTF